MKQFLLLLTILAGSSYAGRSQSSDTLCFPVPVIQKILIAAKQKQLTDSLNAILRSDISIMQQSVSAYKIKDSTNKEIQSNYQALIGTMQQQRAVLDGQILLLNKDVRRWKRKTTFTAIGGILLTAFTTFLFITK